MPDTNIQRLGDNFWQKSISIASATFNPKDLGSSIAANDTVTLFQLPAKSTVTRMYLVNEGATTLSPTNFGNIHLGTAASEGLLSGTDAVTLATQGGRADNIPVDGTQQYLGSGAVVRLKFDDAIATPVDGNITIVVEYVEHTRLGKGTLQTPSNPLS